MFENISWQTWVPLYLQCYAGLKIPGITHNLNNYIHILDMQVSLLSSKCNSKPDTPISDYRDRLDKINENNHNLLDFLHINSNWSFYTQKERIQTGIPDFIDWLTRFWTNDLFCKHKISIEIELEDNLPNLDLPALTLTFCMDQALSNATEACCLINPDVEQNIALNAAAEKNGVRLSLVSPQPMAMDENTAWQAGTSSKEGHLGLGLYLIQDMCADLGWETRIITGAESTEFHLLIPEKKTEFEFGRAD